MVAFIFSPDKKRKTKIAIPDLGSEQEIEVLLEEGFSYSAVTTDSPVEEGSDITDHVRVRPLEYRLSGVFTNAPIAEIYLEDGDIPQLIPNGIIGSALVGALGSLAVTQSRFIEYIGELKDAFEEKTSANIDRLPNIIEFFKGMVQGGAIVSIETRSEVLENLICTSYEYKRDKKTGDALHVSATFKQVTFVSTESVDIEDKESKTSSEKSKEGSTAETKDQGKTKKESTSSQTEGTAAYRLLIGG